MFRKFSKTNFKTARVVYENKCDSFMVVNNVRSRERKRERERVREREREGEKE